MYDYSSGTSADTSTAETGLLVPDSIPSNGSSINEIVVAGECENFIVKQNIQCQQSLDFFSIT